MDHYPGVFARHVYRSERAKNSSGFIGGVGGKLFGLCLVIKYPVVGTSDEFGDYDTYFFNCFAFGKTD